MNHEISNYLLQISKLPHKQQTIALVQLYQLFKDNPAVKRILQLKPLNQLQSNKKQSKIIDFKILKCTKIALKIIYDGQYFNGLAKQTEVQQMLTIENILLEAMYQVQLIPRDVSDKVLQFNRSGRTDTGVSGREQVITVFVRTNANSPITFNDLVNNQQKESDLDVKSIRDKARSPYNADLSYTEQNTFSYLEMINSQLPRQQVRATSFAFVPPEFDARFSAISRSYIYLFPRIAQLGEVQTAANVFIGTKDFRNVCYQTDDVKNYERTINKFTVSEFNESFYRLDIMGSAFLYHQIRCMVSLITLVVTKKVTLDKVLELFDMDGKFGGLNKRPEYQIAPGELLIFNGVEYDSEWGLQWHEQLKSGSTNAQIALLGEMMARTVVTQQLANNADVTPWFLSHCTQTKPW